MAAKTLGELDIGSVVCLKYNGVLTEFIVIQHGKPNAYYNDDCESGTWLQFRDCCGDAIVWSERYEETGSHEDKDYSKSTIHKYLNETIYNLFDAEIKTQIRQVQIPYAVPGINSGFQIKCGNNGLLCYLFALSADEVEAWSNHSGITPFSLSGVLDYYKDWAYNDSDPKDMRRRAKHDGVASNQHLRTPNGEVKEYGPAYYINISGWVNSQNRDIPNTFCRPAFILPSTLAVSESGPVYPKTDGIVPTSPYNITLPSISLKNNYFKVTWSAGSNAEGHELQFCGNGEWSTTINLISPKRTSASWGYTIEATIKVRMRSFSVDGVRSDWVESNECQILENELPTVPESITVPEKIAKGAKFTIRWGTSTDKEGFGGYNLERKIGSGLWSSVYTGPNTSYTDTAATNWEKVTYRVRAYDNSDSRQYSDYITSPERSVILDAAPVITSTTPSGSNLGLKTTGFELSCNVTDEDSDSVIISEYIDNVLQCSYPAQLGQETTVKTGTEEYWQKVLNGTHTLKIVANDGMLDSEPYTVTFEKKVTSASITLETPLDADDQILVTVLSVLGSIPEDANFEVLVTNNANDDEPVWEDATEVGKAGKNFAFTNKNAANGFAYNFKVSVSRGDSDTGGYIATIGGAFQ